MNAQLRNLVVARAGGRCEYCRLPHGVVPSPHSIDHIRAKQHGGKDDESNLAYACSRCNHKKGPNLTGVDPFTGAIVTLFNPRADEWRTHFEMRSGAVVPRSDVGRATCALLEVNEVTRVALRASLATEGVQFT